MNRLTTNFAITTIILLVLTSCQKKETCHPTSSPDYSVFEGRWVVEEVFTSTENGALITSNTRLYELMADGEGSGKLVYPNFETPIQLAYNPTHESISIITVLIASSSGERQLNSEHYQILHINEDSMHWQDIDRLPLEGDITRTTQVDLTLIRQ